MRKNTKRTITMVMVLISVFLLISPVILAKPMAKINDQGLKSLNMRAFIIEEDTPSGHGPKHGRAQALVNEIEKLDPADPTRYSYKFTIDLRKAMPGEEYTLNVTFTLPDIVLTIYGDKKGLWNLIESKAVELGLDGNPEPGVIEISLADLNIADVDFEFNTGKTFITDDRGNYKEVRTGVMEEMVAINYALDLAWPFLWQFLLQEYPAYAGVINYVFSVDRDFMDFGIIGVSIPEGDYVFSGGLRIINTQDDTNVYCTEPLTFTYSTIGFQWWAPGWEP